MLVLLALLAATAQAPATVVALDDGSGDGPAYRFEPTDLVVAPDAPVLLRNDGRDVHTLTHAADARAFHTGPVEPGGSARLAAPAAPGEYPFVCVFHGGMRGTLRVEEAGPADAPDARTPLPAWGALGGLAAGALLLGRRR